MIDQPGSIAQLAIAVAARRQVPVAYVPGLVMRRAADLYPGEAKTDRRDAFVIADTARSRRTRVHWLDTGNDELLVIDSYPALTADGALTVGDTSGIVRAIADDGTLPGSSRPPP